MYKFFFISSLFFILSLSCISQTFNLESIGQNSDRNAQLLGKFDSTISFLTQSNSFYRNNGISSKKFQFRLLPLILINQFNSHHPFGWNDGAMSFSNGFQFLLRTGLNLKHRMFEIQIAPELLFKSNKAYPISSNFGNSLFNSEIKSLHGQSFVKFHLSSLTVGVSNENLWWGPGINSSLLMSNNAPGFWHFSLKTNKPINSPLGYFEFNIIGGRLESNTIVGYENFHLKNRTTKDDWRYLSSFVISFQPKWINGLFVGMSRSMQQYGQQSFGRTNNLFVKYFPVIGNPVQRANNLGDDTLRRDQLASFFLRWVFPKYKFEFYLEYGKNDYGFNYRDYLLSPTHSSAYTIGFRKLIPKTSTKYLQLESEITQMSQSPDYIVRTAGNWYEHGTVVQGYTHQNQIMGAGAGFGANVQTASATWINGELRNGFLVQRIERDPVDRVNKWTDFSIGWMPQWKYKNMLLGAKVQLIRSQNYGWERDNNSFNLHSRLMVQYNFK